MALTQIAQIGLLILVGQTDTTNTATTTELMPSRRPPPCASIYLGPSAVVLNNLCREWMQFGIFWQDAAQLFYDIAEREKYEKLQIAGEHWRLSEQIRILTAVDVTPEAPIPPDIWLDKWPWLLAGGLGLLGIGVVSGIVIGGL